jgi:hypothetical protein
MRISLGVAVAFAAMVKVKEEVYFGATVTITRSIRKAMRMRTSQSGHSIKHNWIMHGHRSERSTIHILRHPLKRPYPSTCGYSRPYLRFTGLIRPRM